MNTIIHTENGILLRPVYLLAWNLHSIGYDHPGIPHGVNVINHLSCDLACIKSTVMQYSVLLTRYSLPLPVVHYLIKINIRYRGLGDPSKVNCSWTSSYVEPLDRRSQLVLSSAIEAR